MYRQDCIVGIVRPLEARDGMNDGIWNEFLKAV